MVIRFNFVDRKKIADRLATADKGNVADFLEMMLQWTRGKNALIEEDCMILSFGYVILLDQVS